MSMSFQSIWIRECLESAIKARRRPQVYTLKATLPVNLEGRPMFTAERLKAVHSLIGL